MTVTHLRDDDDGSEEDNNGNLEETVGTKQSKSDAQPLNEAPLDENVAASENNDGET